MEDSDWTDIPSFSCLENQDSFTHSDTEKDTTWLSCNQDNNVDKKISNIEIKRNDTQQSSNNSKQEKESCPICLSSFEDRSFLDQCFHSFCFCCILQWCEVVQTCPLCKSGFASIIHNVKTVQDYEQYIVEKKNVTSQTAHQTHNEVTYNDHGADEHGNRFRYRTTQQLHARPDSNISHRHHSRHRTSRRNREGWGDEARTRRHSRITHRNKRTKGVERRRQVYAFKLRAIGGLGNGKQRCRNISSKFYKCNPACTHRLITWLLRDLKVLLGNSEEEVNFLVEFILSLITRINMDSDQFLEELRPFLLQTTEHFVHELLSYAKAPFDLNTYDDYVVYPWPEDGEECRENRQANEGRTGCPSDVEHPQDRTSLSHLEWSNSLGDKHEEWDRTEPLFQDQKNENLQLNSTNVDNSTAITETSSLTLRTDSNISEVVGEESRCIENNGTSPQHDGNVLSKQTPASIDERVELVDRVPHSVMHCICNNVPLQSEEVQCMDIIESSVRHKKHKHNKHKQKHKHKRKSKHNTKTGIKASLYSVSESGSYCASQSSAVRSDGMYFQKEGSLEVGEIACNILKEPKSPSVETMLREIDELNDLIQQHEEQLLMLG